MNPTLKWLLPLLCLAAACAKQEQDAAPASLMPPTVASKGQPRQAPRADTVSFAAFKAAFPIMGKPKRMDIRADFGPEQLKAYPHHDALVIRMPDGKLKDFPANDFHLISFSTSTEGNFDIITLRRLGLGTLAHLNSFDKDLNLITVTEIAREHEQDANQSRKWGTFVDEMNYQYTYTSHEKGVLQDSMRGTLVMTGSGKHKVIGEERMQ